MIRRAIRVLARLLRALRAEWYALWRRRPVDPDVVLFESFAGNGATDSPEALFRAILRAPDLLRLRAVWALDRRAAAVMRAEFRSDRRVRVVRRGGLQYWRALATAGTLVNNATFPPQFARRPEQTYLNTWHGTPLKRMGFDEPDGAAAAANTVRNFLQATHLLSQNRYMTDTMYRSAYRLEGLAAAAVLEVGYPRNDRLVLTGAEDAAIRNRLAAAGTRLGTGTRLVVFAPTWRGDSFQAPEDHSHEIAEAASAMQAELDRVGAEARVIVKPHQAVTALARQEPALRRMLAPEDLPVNSLLAVTDVLVSDYSSIVIDFLATGRPIVFAALDGDEYLRTRGLYIPVDELPGPRATSVEALATEVRGAVMDGIKPEHSATYAAWASRFVRDDDGHASERVLDVLFRGRKDPKRPAVHLEPAHERPRMLIHLGGMRANGITTSALNLVNALAELDIDVTALFPMSNRQAARMLRQRIDPRIRSIQRVGGMNGSKLAQLRRRLMDRRRPENVDPMAHVTDPAIAKLWNDEWHRCFGEARFDAVIDFSGYSPFWATLLLHAPKPVVRSMWMHNDMSAEVNRLVGGKPRMRRSLTAVMRLYDQYDRVVAVSESLRAHNAASVDHLRGAQTKAARNLIDDRTVLAGARAPLGVLTDDETKVWPSLGPDEWIPALDDDSLFWYTCVGRLSPEKNHKRLLNAFARVHAERPDTRLMIIGDGYLRETLIGLARDLQIADAVVFTGAVPNPYPLMKRAACAVVSSDHEGQPMVILEAAVLGRPIVATRFDSASDALPGEHLLLVDKTVPALADGMLLAARGEVPAAHLAAADYNRLALGEFFDAVLSSPIPGPRVVDTPDEPSAGTPAEAVADPDATVAFTMEPGTTLPIDVSAPSGPNAER